MYCHLVIEQTCSLAIDNVTKHMMTLHGKKVGGYGID